MTGQRKRRPDGGGADRSWRSGSAAEYSSSQPEATAVRLVVVADDWKLEHWAQCGKRRDKRHKVKWIGNVALGGFRPAGLRIVRSDHGWQIGHWFPQAPRALRWQPWHPPVASCRRVYATLADAMTDRPGRPVWPLLDLRGQDHG